MESNRKIYVYIKRVALSDAVQQLAHCSVLLAFCTLFVFVLFIFYFFGDFYLNTPRFYGIWTVLQRASSKLKKTQIQNNKKKKRRREKWSSLNMLSALSGDQLEPLAPAQEPQLANTISMLLDSFICSYGNSNGIVCVPDWLGSAVSRLGKSMRI